MTPGVASSHPPRRRLQLVAALGIVFWTVLIMRLANLQLVHHQKYLDEADQQHWGRMALPAERGAILDRHHRLLAHNITCKSLVVRTLDPAAALRRGRSRLKGPQRPALPLRLAESYRGRPADSLMVCAAVALAPRLQTDTASLLARMRDKQRFLYLERKMDADRESVWVHGDPLPVGATLEPETRRVRPLGGLAADILGSTDIDGRPLGGVEKRYDSQLRGSSGWVKTFRDGRWVEHQIPERGVRAPVAGYTLELTLDAASQAIVEERLHSAILEHHARGGSVVLLNPNTGEIVAMANESVGRGGKPEPTRPRAITDMIEPGSTFKMVVFAAAIENNLITPGTLLNCEGGTWYLGSGKPIHDDKHDHFGVVPAWYALMKSSNIAAGKVALKLGKDRFVDFARELGFGAYSGVDLPGEAPGYLARPTAGQDRQLATIGFGQGVSVTLMQLAMAYGAIANGGTLMRPQLVRALYDSRGNRVRSFEPETVRRVMSARTAATMRTMLQAVVDSGTASAARMSWLSVGGKTGTAQKAEANRGGYSSGRYMSLFVGFLPVDKPELVMVTMIDEPQGTHYGGLVAAPVFKDVMETLARSGNGPISPPFEVVAPERHAAAPASGGVAPPDVRGGARRAAIARLSAAGFKVNLVGQGDRVVRMEPGPEMPQPSGAAVTLWTDAAPMLKRGSIPPLVGLSLREAVGRLSEVALSARVVGGGRVVRQDPLPGVPAKPGQVVTLYAFTGP